jgi:hypothetical protein
MITVGYRQLESFVAAQNALDVNVRVEGWDLVFFVPKKRAVLAPVKWNTHGTVRTSGAYDRKTGQWGIESRVSCDNTGKWRVPERVIRRTSRPRS